MSDLDEKEQNHVRTALRYLRNRVGAWAPVAKAVRSTQDTLQHTVCLHGRPVSASMALRVARVLDVPIDDLLAGRFLPAGACPHCGHVPDFADEHTAVEDAPRPAIGGGLTVVK